MMNAIDIRWKQRFQNYSRAYQLLRSALENGGIDSLSELEKEGVIQRFEYSYELAWKTMKDYLEAEGVVVNPVTPRTVIKRAFAAGLVEDGQVWVEMMLHRNLLSHTYDFSKFAEVLQALENRYLSAFEQLYHWLLEQQLEP